MRPKQSSHPQQVRIKFTRSVMDAIDAEKYDSMTDFELVDELSSELSECESSAGHRGYPQRRGTS